jgi:hypothetical protein
VDFNDDCISQICFCLGAEALTFYLPIATKDYVSRVENQGYLQPSEPMTGSAGEEDN